MASSFPEAAGLSGYQAGPEAKGWPGEKVPFYILCFSLVGNSVAAKARSTEFRVLFELKNCANASLVFLS